MSAFLLLLALALQEPAGDLAPTLRGQAHVESSVATVEVGEPFTLTLVVWHHGDDAPELDAAALESDPTWAVLDGGELTRLPEPGGEGFAVTSASWSVVSLEAGARDLPAPGVTFGAGSTAPQPIQVERAGIEVRGVLAPGEDAPRPSGGFLGLEPVESTSWARRALPWILGGLVAIAGLATWLLRRRRRAPPVAVASPLERLAVLEGSSLESPEAVVAAHVELVRLLREAVDAVLGPSPSGLTDAEWARHLEARLGAERARSFAELLATCEPVKYGAERPTHWAARERIARARELAQGALAQAGVREVAA